VRGRGSRDGWCGLEEKGRGKMVASGPLDLDGRSGFDVTIPPLRLDTVHHPIYQQRTGLKGVPVPLGGSRPLRSNRRGRIR
jgi:hypothetical protein